MAGTIGFWYKRIEVVKKAKSESEWKAVYEPTKFLGEEMDEVFF